MKKKIQRLTFDLLKNMEGKEFNISQIDEFIDKYKIASVVENKYLEKGKDVISIKIFETGHVIAKFVGEISKDKYVFELDKEVAQKECMLLEIPLF